MPNSGFATLSQLSWRERIYHDNTQFSNTSLLASSKAARPSNKTFTSAFPSLFEAPANKLEFSVGAGQWGSDRFLSSSELLFILENDVLLANTIANAA